VALLATGMLAGPLSAQAHEHGNHDRGSGWAWGRDQDDHRGDRWGDDDHRDHGHGHDRDRRHDGDGYHRG